MRHRQFLYHGPSPAAPCACVGLALPVAEFDAAVTAAGVAALQAHFAAKHGYDAQATPDTTLGRATVLAEWARETLNYKRGNVAHSSACRDGDEIVLTCGFHIPDITLKALQLSVRLAAEAGRGPVAEAGGLPDLERLWAECSRAHPDMQAAILIGAARARDIPVRPLLHGSKVWLFGQGVRSEARFETMGEGDTSIGHLFQQSKTLTKSLLRMLGLPVCRDAVMRRAEDVGQAEANVGYPCVTKPIAAGRSRGVSVNLASREALVEGYRRAAELSGGQVLVEPYMTGAEYRLMVFHGRFVTALRRARPAVTGDGKRSIRQLVEDENATRAASLVKANYHVPIAVDGVMEAQLAQLGVTFETVPRADEHVVVRGVRGRSAGGHTVREDDRVHPKLKAMVVDAARLLRLDVVGYDFITDDISADPDEINCAFLEANTTPALPAAVQGGWHPDEIGGLVLGERPGRVPTRLVVRPHADSVSPQVPEGGALCVGRHVFLGHRHFRAPDEGPWPGLDAAIKLPSVERIEIRARPEDIVKHGFPLDRFDEIELAPDALPAPWARLAERLAPTLRHAAPGASVPPAV